MGAVYIHVYTLVYTPAITRRPGYIIIQHIIVCVYTRNACIMHIHDMYMYTRRNLYKHVQCMRMEVHVANGSYRIPCVSVCVEITPT